MPFILIRGGPEKGKAYELGPQPTTIGRDKTQTIQVLDHGVSRAHAEIFKVGELFFLRDLKSTNGTFLNGTKIEEDALKTGDEILIGTTLMRYAESLPTPHPADGTADAELAPDAVELAVETAADLPASSSSSKRIKAIDAGRLQEAYDISRALMHGDDARSQIASALEILLRILKASHGYLLNVNPEGRWTTQIQVPRDSDGEVSAISRAIVRHVIRTRRPTLSSDATVDDRFTYSESIVLRRIRSVIAVPLYSGGQVAGVVYLHKPEAASFSVEDLETVARAGLQISMAIETDSFQRRLRKGLDAAVRTLVQNMEALERDSQGHAVRVADFSQAIATEMGLSREEIYKIRLSAMLHDVGKLSGQKFDESAVPGAPDPRHVHAGEKIVAVMEGGSELLPGVRFHHERADGSGYPYKIKNAETPVMARIIIVANQFENEQRPADKPPIKDILKNLAAQAGGRYDADAVNALLLAHRKDSLFQVPDIFAKE